MLDSIIIFVYDLKWYLILDVVTIPAMGDIRIDQGTSGTGKDRIDDVTPNVWEEAYGTGLTSGIINPAGGSAGTTIEYTQSMTPDGATVRIAFSPQAGGSNAGDKAGSGTIAGVAKSSWDFTLGLTSDVTGIDGLTLDLGLAVVDQDTGNAIRGAGRADFYFGMGDRAGAKAGYFHEWGDVFYIVKRADQPEENS